jgi:hypothetical protein
MKSLIFLVILFLFIPGSGQLVWDGIPLNNRAEFATLVLMIVVIFSRELRRPFHQWYFRFQGRGLLKPLLVVLCLLKFISFAWSPMSEGFESCYRSLYNPLENADTCEKSYDAPFLRAEGLLQKNASRVDHVVDFGEFPYDWSLPFMNEYPRLGDLWLKRFPFSAKYSAEINNEERAPRLLPIYGIGELNVKLNGKVSADVEMYDRAFVTALDLAPGPSQLVVEYQYRDEDSTNPEVEPAPRGPYAQLKIGEPMTASELAKVSLVRVSGSVRGLDRSLLEELKVRDRNGRVVEFVDLNAARDAQDDPDQLLRPFDLEIEIPAISLASAPLKITTGTSSLLGTIIDDPSIALTPRVEQSPASAAAIQLSATLAADRDSLTALAPGVRDTPGPALRILLVLLDLISLVITAAMAAVIVRTLRSVFALSLGLAAVAWLVVNPFDAIIPSFAGGGRELVIPYAVIALLVIATRQHGNRYPLPFLLPVATVLASQKVFEHLHYNHPGHSARWWGTLIFYWRDSDWFANNGYARTIFVEGSLRGGEPVFWFQSAPRYLAVAFRYVLGENDVLIGLIVVAAGFLALCTLVARFAAHYTDRSSHTLAVFAAFIGLIFLGDQMITALGFFVSSEYPTWIILLGVTAFMLRPNREDRVWVTTSLSAVIAVMVHFRPNNLFVSVSLFLLVVTLKIEKRDRTALARQAGWAVSTYLLVLSLSLVHNLYYGDSFVPLTTNASINYAFSWTGIWAEEGVWGSIVVIWTQLSSLMYWRVPNDPSYAIVFWGSQLALVIAFVHSIRGKGLRNVSNWYVFLPLTYILPMLKFQYTSYYPRHLVAASLLCLCSALLVWPRNSSQLVSKSS